jgi:hypothetical protein
MSDLKQAMMNNAGAWTAMDHMSIQTMCDNIRYRDMLNKVLHDKINDIYVLWKDLPHNYARIRMALDDIPHIMITSDHVNHLASFYDDGDQFCGIRSQGFLAILSPTREIIDAQWKAVLAAKVIQVFETEGKDAAILFKLTNA